MKCFLDERCLGSLDLISVLTCWRGIVDFVAARAPGVELWLDRRALQDGEFLKRFNSLKPDFLRLWRPMLFGSTFRDWTLERLSGDTLCQLSTELGEVADCAVCEIYEVSGVLPEVALLGSETSSYVGYSQIEIQRIEPKGQERNVACGTTLEDIHQISVAWDCISILYDISEKRPPRDDETVLGRAPERFVRTGRFERNGRRQVYREVATGRLFYVDNLHYGVAAHLEVFDAAEMHIGTADLEGNLHADSRVAGRTVSW